MKPESQIDTKALDETTRYTASILLMEDKIEDAAIIAHGIVHAYLTALSDKEGSGE